MNGDLLLKLELRSNPNMLCVVRARDGAIDRGVRIFRAGMQVGDARSR